MNTFKAIISSYLGVLVFAGFIFLGAWKFDYWQGLLYVALALLGTTLNHLLVKPGSNITVNRAHEAKEGEAWDKRLLGLMFLASLAAFLTAGLDSGRFGWSGPVPFGITIAGILLMVTGQILFALAKRENAFFSSTVRIQAERNHRVCDTGLYLFVRHPGYLGLLLSQLAFPLVMNAYWAIIPTLLGVVLLMVRTLREDKFLVERLPGYAAYARTTRWRLFPGVF